LTSLRQEQVSPELVLVDPELAERERARLREKARLQTIVDVAALRRAVERDTQPAELVAETQRPKAVGFVRRRILPVALMGSLLANGYLAAQLLAREDEKPNAVAPVAFRPVTVTTQSSKTAATQVTVPRRRRSNAISSRPLRPRQRRHAVTTKASVERKLVSLIVTAPARKLPPAFIDPETGLVRNNVQVACRRAEKQSFLCSVRLPNDSATDGVFVRYGPGRGGKPTFTFNRSQ
jgi:hypothetical protein